MFVTYLPVRSPDSPQVEVTHHVLVGEVELPGLFEDHVLTLLPLWVLVLQVHPEPLDVFDT